MPQSDNPPQGIDHERIAWLGFSLCPGVGPKKFGLLYTHFGSAAHAWIASEKEIATLLGSALTQRFLLFRNQTDLSSLAERLAKQQTHFVTLHDEAYPQLLKKSSNPPSVLFVKGELDFNAPDNMLTIGIVGTRKITSYGRQVTEMITAELVSYGAIIVSGLALGVDSVAHRTTIEQGGKTVAVLGCGIECCHPSSHQRLYDNILSSGGAVVSEFPFEVPPTKGSFPSRNRIIAGLSRGIVVTEGAADSGALITANDAFSDGREVFAVPGPITSSLSKGPNSLLGRGGKLVTSGQDVLKGLGLGQKKVRRNPEKILLGETSEEQKIIDLLMDEQLHFDEIVQRVGIDSSKIAILLSLMEMRGIVKNTEQGFSLSE